MSTRVKLVGLLAIPVIALVAVAFAFGFSHSTSEPVEAGVPTGGMNLEVKSGAKPCDPTKPTPAPPLDDDSVCVSVSGALVISVSIDALPKADGFLTVQSFVSHGNLVYKGGLAEDDIDAAFNCAALKLGNVDNVNNNVSTSCTDGTVIAPVPILTVGQYVDHSFTCTAAASTVVVTLEPLGGGVAGGSGAGFIHSDGVTTTGASDSLTIQCIVQPTGTPTQTPTETFTPTPTNTPVSEPPFVKSPSLQNLFLTRQGTKIPPVQCVGPQGSNDTAEFDMSLDVAIAATDPKGSGKVVDLGAFEFEVHYDAQKVCVEIVQAQASITMLCFIEDDVTKPVLEGVARIGCVTVGKKLDVNGVWNISVTALGGLLASNCVVIVQEAPVGIPTFPFPVKGAMIVTGPPGLDLQPLVAGDQNCVGTTGTFGWVSFPGGFDNVGGGFTAVIPCNPPNLGTSCSAPGKVNGSFFQEPTTLDMALTATFQIAAIVGGLPVAITDGEIVGARKSRFALDLATVIVRPQPDVYSQAIPNQNNGVVVQLNNQKCELADQQGHPIAHFSCGDADVTIRYLEGDVEPDCSVNTLDTQAIAFRGGASKGTLLFLDRFNLEPFGTQSDDDIDIKDLQAVYGRIGSTCANPHPDQPPVNPKA